VKWDQSEIQAKEWTEAELGAGATPSKRLGRKPTGRWDEDWEAAAESAEASRP
jgi:hypothetical protein